MHCTLVKIEFENDTISKVLILENNLKIQIRKLDFDTKIKNYLIEDYGKTSKFEFDVIDNIKLIKEPVLDGIYVYVTDSVYYIYQKRSKQISGYLYGKKIISQFELLSEYHFIEDSKQENIKQNIKIDTKKEIIKNYEPNKNTVLDELKSSPKFMELKNLL